jgi:hypothetical protein
VKRFGHYFEVLTYILAAAAVFFAGLLAVDAITEYFWPPNREPPPAEYERCYSEGWHVDCRELEHRR